MDQAEIDTVVIGAGAVGLACARSLALAGCEVIVVEAADAIGTETSSRNSEVIHAGIYYPTGSLKAEMCVEGKVKLYEYCKSHGVPFNNCGKLIVATDADQVDGLHGIIKKAADNGVGDLTFIGGNEARELEPAVSCIAAAYSPSTGIIDSHSLMLSYQGEAEENGAMIAFNAPFLSGEVLGDGRIALEIGGEMPMRLIARQVINSGGLHAPALARKIDGLPQDKVPNAYYCKGNYFTVTGKNPFSRLIYPMPQQAGLGVHVTLDIGGQLRFGPDVEWQDDISYDVDPQRADVFYDAVRTYWPDLEDGALQPGYAGIRPKITPQGTAAADFVIQGPEDNGVAGLVNLFGIESPGLTASIAIGDRVASLLST